MKIKRLASTFLAAALAASAALAVGVSADTDTPEVFTDSLTDMTKVYQKDGTFQCDSNTNLEGDQCVAIDYGYYTEIAPDGTMTQFPSLTWKVNGGAKVEVFVYLWENMDFGFSWSADGEEFTSIPENVVAKDSDITTENAADKGLGDEYKGKADVIRKLYTIDEVDASAKYLKVTWPQMDASYKAQLSMFRATGGTKAAVTDITADTVASVTLGDQAATTAYWYDYSQGKFDWDESIKNADEGVIPYINLEYGKEVAPETYVTYKVKAGSPFLLKYARHVSMTEDTLIKLYSSEDNKAWIELTDTIHTEKSLGDQTGYIGVTDIVEAIPATHKYVKVVWPDVGTVNYGVGLISAKYNKTDELPQEDNLKEIAATAVEATDTAAWDSYSKDKFQWSQKIWLNGQGQEPNIPFVIVDSAKTAAPNAYVTYRVKAGSAFILNFAKHVNAQGKPDMKLYSSADGAAWEEIADFDASQKAITDLAGGDSGYSRVTFRVEAIPAEHQYVKVEWPDLTQDGYPSYGVGLISVKLMEPEENVTPEKPDHSAALDKITGSTSITFSGNKDTDTQKMASYSKEGIDFGQMLQVGEENIPVLMLDSWFVEGKNELPELYVVYKVKANSPFKVQGLTHQAALDLELKFRFMVSADGKEWKELDGVLYDNEAIKGTSWLKETYGVTSLGEARYVKVVWPNQKDYTGTINPVSGETLDSVSYAPALTALFFNGEKTEQGGQDNSSGENNPGTGVALPVTMFWTAGAAGTALYAVRRRKAGK